MQATAPELPGVNPQVHILSFEGPDPYSMVGGLGTRVVSLAESLAEAGAEAHLWFVGDPDLPAEQMDAGGVHLHRWCQPVSRGRPGGVYDGDADKSADFATTLPPVLTHQWLLPALARGVHPIVLAEEWQTANAVLHLDWLLREGGVRSKVSMTWNANNTYGFDFIDWPRMRDAAMITTVSRYMRELMLPLGVDPHVMPNGLPADAFAAPPEDMVRGLRARIGERSILAKIGRFHPDKNWMSAIALVAALAEEGCRPLLIARGGSEAYGGEVLAAARQAGLRVADCDEIAGAAEVGGAADVVNLRRPLDPPSRRWLMAASDAVLANSVHEPFGLVGLETMAVGGIACTGQTGEDYVVAGRNAVVMSGDARTDLSTMRELLGGGADAASAMRRSAVMTAREYRWPALLDQHLWPGIRQSSAARGEQPFAANQ